MREAGKKKMETQLPHLWNPHKIKKKSDKMKLRYKISIWVVTCTRRLSPLGRKRLALAGRDMCREIPHSATLTIGSAVYCFRHRPGIPYAGIDVVWKETGEG